MLSRSSITLLILIVNFCFLAYFSDWLDYFIEVCLSCSGSLWWSFTSEVHSLKHVHSYPRMAVVLTGLSLTVFVPDYTHWVLYDFQQLPRDIYCSTVWSNGIQDLLHGQFLRPAFEVFWDPSWPFLSCLFPSLSLIKYPSYVSICCSDEVTST